MPPSSAQAYQTLQDFNSKRTSNADLLTQAENKYGVNDLSARANNLRTLVGNLQTSIDQVDPSVTGRTSGSLVTEAQRSALVNRERAPLVSDFNKTSGNYGNAQSDLATARSQARDWGTSLITEQDAKYKSLMDAYQIALNAEQEAEKKRQFDASLAESTAARKAASGAGGYDLGLGGGLGGAPVGLSMTKRSGGGFNFTDASGKAISAARYAQLTGQDVMKVLQKMGQNGDKYAAEAYYQISKTKNPQARATAISHYSPLFWGT